MNELFSAMKKHKINDNNIEDIDYYNMYFISCCLDDIWGKKITFLKTNKINIEEVYEEEMYFQGEKYKEIIHKIPLKINKNNLILQIISTDNKPPWDLNEIKINSNKSVCFDDLSIDNSFLESFSEYINSLNNKKDDNEIKIKENKEKKVFIHLEEKEKLRLFVKYFKNEYLKNKDKEKIIDKYISNNLVKKFYEVYKNKELIEYSFLFTLFNLSCTSKTIFDFLDIYPKINMIFDEINKNDIDLSIINNYNKDRNKFLEEFEYIYKNEKKENKNYINLLESFIIIYKLKYEDEQKIEKQILINAKPIIKEIINNKPDLNKYLSFVQDNYNMLYIILNSDKKEFLVVEPQLINDDIFDFDFFKSLHKLLIEKEEKYGKILNLSKIGNHYLNIFLKDKNEIVEYSNIIYIFTLLYNSIRITNLLDNFSKLNYDFNIVDNKSFKKILIIYVKKHSQFISQNQQNFKKLKINEIKNEKNVEQRFINSLENFMIIYQLFYEDPTKIDINKLIYVRPILNEIINNKNDLISCMKFILEKFKLFSRIFNKDNYLDIESRLIEEKPINIENFKKLYNEIIEKEKEFGFYINFFKIFNCLYDNYNEEYKYLVLIKNLYEEELKFFGNKDFEEKIINSIHIKGLDKIRKEKYNNNFLVTYIINNDYYTKKKFEKNENKDFSILDYFIIEEMDEKFFSLYQNNKIYSFFKEDLNQYIEHFCKRIKYINYFYYFFELLPIENYNNDMIKLLNNWLIEKISLNSFTEKQFPNFAYGMKNLFKIMLDNKLTNEIITLLKFLKNNIGESYKLLIIYLLQIFENINNEEVAKNMIKFLLFPNTKKDNEIYDINTISFHNITEFLKEIKPSKLIIKIFLSEIKNLSICKNDFFIKSIKFQLFEKLLKNSDYSILSKQNNNKNSDYWQNVESTCESLENDLKNLNINYKEIKTAYAIVGKKEILERIDLIFLCLKKDKNQEIINDIKEKIDDAMKKIESNTKDIEQLKLFNIFINFKKPDINKELSNYNLNIITSPLSRIYSDKEFSKYENEIKKAKQFLPLKKSFVFLCIFNNLKDLEKSLEKMKNLKKLFSNNERTIERELKNIYEVKYLIFIGYENEKKLSQEIDWFLEYFGIKNYDKSLLLKKIKIYIENQSLFSVISGILILFDTYKYITKSEDTFYKKLEDYKSILKEKELISIEDIDKINREIENELDIQNSGNNKKDYYDFFILLNQYPNSINFLLDKKSEQINNLFDYLLETGDIVLKDKDIFDFIKTVKFFEGINNIDESVLVSFKKFSNHIIKGSKDNFLCGLSLKNYIIKYEYIKKIFDKFLKHSEGFFREIMKIIDKSELKISLNNKEHYVIRDFYYIINNNNSIIEVKNNLSYENLENLFQRAVITEIPKEYKFKNKVEIFKEFFKNLNKIIDLLNVLHEAGYQHNLEIEIKINEGKIICFYELKTFSIEELIKKFFILKETISQMLLIYYKKSEIIRLFNGRQIKLIYSNILSDIEKKENKNIDLFQVISNNIIEGKIQKKYKFNFTNSKESDQYCEILNEITKYLESYLKLNNKTIENIYNFNEILEERKKEINNKFKGIYYYKTNKKQEIVSLNIYKSLTGNLPIDICFFYCSKYINTQELYCFLFRCFNCFYNCLFCIINIDLLNIEQKNKLISLIKEFSQNYRKNMKSCLLIILNDMDNLSIKRISKIKNAQTLPDLKETFFIFNNKYFSYVVSSSLCGLGKSEKIKDGTIHKELNNIKDIKHKKNYIYFPLGGTFSRDDLIKRIKDLPDMSDLKKKYLIHFDITQTKEVILLNEFIFKLLILRKLDIYEDAKYLGENVEIIFEVPNDFQNYDKEINILSFVNKFEISEVEGIKDSKELITVASIISMAEKDEILENNFDLQKKEFVLSHKKSQEIVLKYFKESKIDNPNYYQINTFIKVLYESFMTFSGMESLSPNNIITKNLDIRKFIIESLLKLIKNMLLGPYEELVKNQQIYEDLMKGNKEENEKLINDKLNNIKKISYDQIKPSLVVFTEDGGSINIIATCSENDKEYSDLEKLYNMQNIKKQKLKLFKELQKDEIFDNVKNFLNCNLNDNEIKKRIGNYVYTQDNFIKVVLIFMRIRAKIPIIMMGETGCGKTSLIEMASKLVNYNNNENVTLKKLNIHAGISDKDIIEFFDKINDEIKKEDDNIYNSKIKEFKKNSELYLKNNKKKDIYSKFEEDKKNRKIWIFIDEINTCNSMGLLSEIFSKNTIYGKKLDERYTYIAACNPYRKVKENEKTLDVLYKNENMKRKLVYAVNPMPITLLNFVFNFGSLNGEDEKKYIQSMITGNINKILNNEIKDKDIITKIINIGTECVKLCHNYLKDNNDASIVSLREVNRYNNFVDIFFKYINLRKEKKILNNSKNEEKIFKFYKSKSKIDLLICSMNLSLFICYYLRLPNKDSRTVLEKQLNEKKYFIDGFLEIPLMELNYIANNLEIPKGIAKNKILKENLFILFFCLINQIPIVLCGKLGRSKTLSLKILQKSLKGKDSKSLICQQYSELKIFRIQGSSYTKSSEIISIFQKGRNYQRENKGNKIVVICIDEMGLADMSENNPLKVLHFELEKEENKVSFVGISNWFLDAAKMNRVVYNVVQDPDKEDIIETSKEIVKSYEKKNENYMERYGNIFIKVSEAYYKYMNKKKRESFR